MTIKAKKFQAVQLDTVVSNLLSKDRKLSNQALVLSMAYLSLYNSSHRHGYHRH